MCQSYTRGQDNHCDRCGYVWGINDPDPPQCKTDKQIKDEAVAKRIAAMIRGLE